MIDSTIESASTPFAVRSLSSESTVFLSGKDLSAYLKQFATDGAPKLHELEISGLLAAAEQATASKPALAGKQDAKIEGAVQIAIGVKKEVDFPTWYTNVLIKADMLDYYNVSGCYILRPASYSIWEIIQGMFASWRVIFGLLRYGVEWFNGHIKAMGVQNAYFPMFVSSKVLEREKDHVEGFSPEVAWVTRA